MVKYTIAAIGFIVAIIALAFTSWSLIIEAISLAPCSIFMAVCLMIPAALFAGAVGFMLKGNWFYVPMILAGFAVLTVLMSIQFAEILETSNAKWFAFMSLIASGMTAAAYDFASKIKSNQGAGKVTRLIPAHHASLSLSTSQRF